MMINSEVQKPDDTTLILKRMLKAPQGPGFSGMDNGGTYPAVDAARTWDGGSAG
jgi:hypothetical protein